MGLLLEGNMKFKPEFWQLYAEFTDGDTAAYFDPCFTLAETNDLIWQALGDNGLTDGPRVLHFTCDFTTGALESVRDVTDELVTPMRVHLIAAE